MNTCSLRRSPSSPFSPVRPSSYWLPEYPQQYLFFGALCDKCIFQAAYLQEECLIFFFSLLAFHFHLLQFFCALVELVFELLVGLSFGEEGFFEDDDLALHLHHLLAVSCCGFCLVFAHLHALASLWILDYYKQYTTKKLDGFGNGKRLRGWLGNDARFLGVELTKFWEIMWRLERVFFCSNRCFPMCFFSFENVFLFLDR